MTTKILIAGFGGQGVLFAGKAIAKMGMDKELQVSWLPSYGPEMRGGTANCSVILSDEEIGSPIVNIPDILFSFNIQSFDKFESTIAPGGMLFADTTLIFKRSTRTDIKTYYIPATELASQNDLKGGANVIMLGKFVAESGLFDKDEFIDHMVSSIPASKASLIENNRKAFALGYNYKS